MKKYFTFDKILFYIVILIFLMMIIADHNGLIAEFQYSDPNFHEIPKP